MTTRTLASRALTGTAGVIRFAAYLSIAAVILVSIAPSDTGLHLNSPAWGVLVITLALLGVDRIADVLRGYGARTAPSLDLPPRTSYVATTIGGATVAVHSHTRQGVQGAAWVCFGCDQRGAEGGSWGVNFGYPAALPRVIRAADQHAAACRLAAKPDQD